MYCMNTLMYYTYMYGYIYVAHITLQWHRLGTLQWEHSSAKKRPWNPLGTSWSIKPRQHNGPTATTSPARRWSEGTIPCSAQYSLNHTWNNVPGFGPLNGRKMLTNFKDVNESEAHDLWAELKAAEVEEGGKSAHIEWAE